MLQILSNFMEIKCSKFERNRNMERLFLCNLNIFVILCEEEKCKENQEVFMDKYLKKC